MSERPGVPERAAGPVTRARLGLWLAVLVAAFEGVVVCVAGVAAVVSGLLDGSWVLGLAVGLVALGAGVLLLQAARAFLAGRRWPRGIFVTVQVLLVLVVLSVGAPSLLDVAGSTRIAGLTLAGLLLGVAGLVGVALGGAALSGEAPGGTSPRADG